VRRWSSSETQNKSSSSRDRSSSRRCGRWRTQPYAALPSSHLSRRDERAHTSSSS